MPDKTPLANSIELSIAKKKPGFKANYLLFKKNIVQKKDLKNIFFGQVNNYEEVLINDYKLIKDTMYYQSYTLNAEFQKVHVSNLYSHKFKNGVKEKTFILGTDKYGRDLLSRIILGTRVSFSVGFISRE